MKLFWFPFSSQENLESSTTPSTARANLPDNSIFNCMQEKMDAFCNEISEGRYPFARKKDAFSSWYCYAELDYNSDKSNQCIVWVGRPLVPCTPFAPESAFIEPLTAINDDIHDTLDIFTDICMSRQMKKRPV